ncbi:hypothetical protein EBR57_03970 [bacterium]|nr:hypothetical protein [bacterium]
MSLTKWGGLLVAATLLNPSIFANTANIGVISAPKITIEPAFDYYHFDYKEDLTLPYKSTEYGYVPGIRIGVEVTNTTLLKDRGSLSGHLRFSSAEVTYDGSTQSGVPVMSTTRNTFYELAGFINTNLFPKAPIRCDGFIGLTYDRWDRNLSTYSEVYTWISVPIGVEIKASPIRSLGLSLRAAYVPMVYGNIGINITSPPINLALGNVAGYTLDAKITAHLNPNMALWTSAYLHRYQFGQSGEALIIDSNWNLYTIHEPSSTTTVYGVMVGLGFGI